MKTRTHSYRKIVLIAAGIMILLYAVAGFFILPPFLKSKLQETIASRTGMTTVVGGLRINPFALSVTVDDFSLSGRDGQSLLAFKQLYINLEARSIVSGAVVFSTVAIDSPFVHVILFADGTTNLPSMAQSDTTSPAPDSTAARSFFVEIDRFELTRGRTIYEDRTHATPRIARFDSLNLALNDFTTRPNGKGEYQFDASTDRGEKLSWHGSIQVAPFASSGSIALSGIKARTAWEFMQDRLNYELTDGDVSMHAEYVLDMSGSQVQFGLHHGEVNVRTLRLIDNETHTEQVSLPSTTIAPIDLDYASNTIHIGTVTSANAVLHTARDLKGDLSLPALLMMKPIPNAPKESPWKITLDRIQLNDFSVQISDQNTDPPTPIVLSPVTVTIEHYHVNTSVPASLVVQGKMQPAGTFGVSGVFTDLPVTAAITLSCSAVQLPTFQRFVDKFANLQIESGALSVNGNLHYAAIGRDTTINFAGSASVSSFRATDRLLNKDFLRWRSLEMHSIAFARVPASLSIGEIVAQEAYIRFMIDTSHVSNIQKIMAVHADSLKRGEAPTTAPDTLGRAQAGMPTRIGLIRIVNGSMNFADYSLSPNFVTGIQEMNGTIVKLNSEQLTHAEMSLDGKVDRYAPVEIRGQINPLSERAYTNITMKFHNIELTTFTPYFGKFAGYKIDKGKLSLDLHYKLNRDTLEASNAIVIDQLTLGEKVEGPDVTSLPVRLAVALLKDSKGVIDLDLPLKGSLNDPEFSVFPIIMKVLVNVLTKAVTSPFKLLSSLIGSGEGDLSSVQFRPGIDTLEAGEQSKLDALVKALNKRPALRLDVRGLVCDSLDRRAVAEARFLRQIRTKGGAGSTVTDADRERILDLYTEHFKTDADLLVPETKGSNREAVSKEQRRSKIVSAAREKLVETLLPDDDALLGLARRRAMAVKDRLVYKSGIEAGRIFLLDFEKGAMAKDGMVQMPLSLDAQ